MLIDVPPAAKEDGNKDNASKDNNPPAAAKTDTSLIADANVIDFSKGKPEGFPDDYWDAEKNTIRAEKMYEGLKHQEKIALGLRQKLSRGEFEGQAPKDIAEYQLTLADEVKDLVPNDDPLILTAKEAAQKAGIPKEHFDKLMTPLVNKFLELNKPQSDEEIKAAQEAQVAQEMEKLGTSAPAIASSVKSFVGELVAKGVFTQEDASAIAESITTAEALRGWNRLRSYVNNTPTVPVENLAATTTGASKAELEAELVKAAQANDEARFNQISQKLSKLG